MADPDGIAVAALSEYQRCAAVAVSALHGVSEGDFVLALEQFLGSAAGPSASTIIRSTEQWQDDHKAFCARDLPQVDYVYVCAS